MKNITVVLVDRANYGRMKPVMRELDAHPDINMQLVVTGTMLLERFGKAVDVVETDGFRVDERVYIDGETFPSHLGTGTEDYYGYAWGMANVWSSAFISAPSRDNRGKNNWHGYQTVSRERMLDAIPFRTSLKVDMEVGVWYPHKATYSVGAMWYGRQGATHNRTMGTTQGRRETH